MRCLRGGRTLTPLSETWRSVIEQQASHETPLWSLADSESAGARNAHSRDGITDEIRASDDYPFIPISSLGAAFVTSVGTKLPSQDACQPLFESFVLSTHLAIPICHIPSLRNAYSEFWHHLSPGTSAELLLLVLAILYTSLANSSGLETSGQSTALYELYDELARALDLSSYYATLSPSSIMLLQSILIMNTFRAGHVAPFTAFGFLPLAIRFAQLLRLHVDRNTGSDVDRDVQRRLWWHLSASHTAKMPSITGSIPLVGSEHNMTPSPMIIAMQGHWEWAHRMQVWYERKPEHHEIAYFGRVIENLLKMVGEDRESEWARV
ncbi:hypothetical protein V1525DRAFT_386470 [Lipomyces kononenkoae]|uniref:Uncharacterized protein n=1 Tax=Lipomyces kononenkoae TaxID=34357 RepID=A0ACC3T7N7_LIPKO